MISRNDVALACALLLVGCSDGATRQAVVEDRPVVTATMSLTDGACGFPQPPVAVYLKNVSNGPITNVHWYFEVHRSGYSKPLSGDKILAEMDPERTTDKIIQPGQTFKVCSSAPSMIESYPANELVYSVFASGQAYRPS